MFYLRNSLSVLAALLIAVLGPGLANAFRGINNSKATGVAAIGAGLLETLLTPWCWVLGISIFALFYFCSRLSSKTLRIFLFWTPATAISILGISILGLFAYMWIYMWIHFDRR